MSQSSRRLLSAVLCAAPLIGAGLFCSSAHAANQGGVPGPESFTLSPVVQQQEEAAQQAGATTAQASPNGEPLYMDAPPDDKPNIHGFFESPFKTSYTTPRGLVVFDHGVVWQPVVGLVLPLAFDLGQYVTKPTLVAGIWNSVAMSQADPSVGGWEEMDVFVDLGVTVASKLKVDLTFGDWNFPTSFLATKPKAEKNIDVKFVYDDSDIWGKDSGFSINPYADVFFAVAGSSTVVLGRQGSTGYVELGIVPTYTYKGIANWPITLTMPIYCSVGPAGYWGEEISGGHHDGNFGLLSASLNGQVPLPFIPVKYGYWHADAGISYYYLKNNNLLQAGTDVSGNTDRNFVQGSVGIGVNF